MLWFVIAFFSFGFLLAGTATGISLFQGVGAHSSDCIWHPGEVVFSRIFARLRDVPTSSSCLQPATAVKTVPGVPCGVLCVCVLCALNKCSSVLPPNAELIS